MPLDAPSHVKPSAVLQDTVIQEKLRAIVGAAFVRSAISTDGEPHLVVEPANDREVAAVLQCANNDGAIVIPRGGGTKHDWGNPPTGAGIVLSTARLNRVIEHPWADLTVTVQAGCTISQLQQAVAQHGQRLAVDVLWPDTATIGGILSTNDSGALRLRYGSLRDLIIGVTLALPDGTLASSGGKVVKNVAGYDLPKLATGALGTLGVITQAVFRLHPLPQNTRTLSIRADSLRRIGDLVLALQDSRLAHSALQVRLARNSASEADILLEGTLAGLASQEAKIREIAGPNLVLEAADAVWSSRERLWPVNQDSPNGAAGSTSAVSIAKLSILPSDIEKTFASVDRESSAHNAAWTAVVQATGIGYLRLDADPPAGQSILRNLRAELEHDGGSLVILRQPASPVPLESWGAVGDALPLMRAVKQQFDPRGTLNPGRFIAGI